MKYCIKIILLYCGFVLHTNKGISQLNNESTFYHKGGVLGNIGATTLSTGNSGTGANINVVYHRCNWIANPDDATKTLKGTVTTYFKTIVGGVNSIDFDFNNTSFNNDSLIVLYHGTACNFSFPVSGNIDVLTIDLPVTLASAGILDSVTIKYLGVPPADFGNALGYQRDVDAAANNYIYTLSESYEDKDWWPCKADMQDKIDSIDINVTVPTGFWVASNGLMTDSAINGASRTFNFKHRYPIASYLVFLGIAKFKKFDLGTLPVGNKDVPFLINIFPGKTSTVEASILNYMNNNKLVFEAFNNLYGDYPYANEKHGFYEFGFGGGMEHQTFSGIGGSNLQSNSVLAHELGHQWFGDKVTFATWNHLWLAEGFATYSEILAAEFVPSLGVNAINKRTNNKYSARGNTGISTYISTISNSNDIWSGNNITAVYNRGCMVVSMLRTLLGDDKFFAGCKSYLNDTLLAYKAATSTDLQRNMESQFGESMAGFFTEWVTKIGIPDYNVQWGNVGNKINIKLAQTVTATGSSGIASTFFPMPVVLKIANAANTQDTTIVIYHKAANQLMYSGNGVGNLVNSNTISYNLSFIPSTVTFDTENKTMANGTVAFSTILATTKADLAVDKLQTNNKITASITTADIIEKVELQKSTDGINFTSAALMQLINPAGVYKQYQQFDDDNSATVYYRAEVYSNGNIFFSNVVAIQNNVVAGKVVVSPNPAQDFVKVSLNNANGNKMTVKITDVSGKILQTQNTNSNSITLATSSFSNGVYILNIFKEEKLIATEKLTIKR